MLDPNIFFTASLTGCLVHVDGDPWSPLVYHSNAQSLPQAPRATADAVMRAKADHMRTQIGRAATAHPKPGRVYAARSLSSLDYTPAHASRDELFRISDEAARVHGVESRRMDANQSGTVFGIRSRSTGTWTFYYQTIVKYRFTKLVQDNWVQSERWSSMSCRKFWPGDDIQTPIRITIHPDDVEEEEES
jgi:hypothetical protein